MKMKLAMTALAAFLVTSLSSPAFAQDWDMQPEAQVTQTAQEFNGSAQFGTNTLSSQNVTESGTQFDLSSLTPAVLQESQPSAQPDQSNPSEYVSQTTARTANQALPTLPICATHTLAVITGPVGQNGLPMCGTDMP